MMMTAAEITEIAIITLSSSFALGYLIGMTKYLVDLNKSEGKITLPLV
jgi:hypothetical protein